MYLVTSGVNPADEHLVHYGVLGMKWHVHKAKQYRAKGDAVRKKQNDLYNKARDKRADAEYQKQNHNTVTAKRYNKEAKDIEKSADKLNKILDKLDKKKNKHNDKNKKAIDEKVEKMKQSEKYQLLEKSKQTWDDVYNQRKTDWDNGKLYDRSDKIEREAEARNVKKADDIMSKQNKHWDDMVKNDFMVFKNSKYTAEDVNKAIEEHSKIQDKLNHDYINSKEYEVAAYNDLQNRNRQWREENQAKQNEMEDKTRKKYRKYIVHTYGVSENELYHHGVKGMHWGVRRYQNYDGTLIKSGSAVQKKTRYTNIDGSLNERGKLHSQKYISKQIKKNDKYYDKQIKKYNKLLAKCGDDKKMQKTFKDMIKDAERTRKSVNENIKKFGIDQIMSNEHDDRTKALRAAGMIAAGTAITATGVGGGLVAAANAGMISAGAAKVGETLMKFDPMTIGDKAMDFAYNDPRGQKIGEYLEGGIRAYADARSYVIGVCADQAINRFQTLDAQFGTTDKLATLAGGTGAKIANNFQQNLNAQNQALVANLSNPNTINQLNTMLGGVSSSANQLATSFDPAMVASMEALYSNPQYAQAIAYANQRMR